MRYPARSIILPEKQFVPIRQLGPKPVHANRFPVPVCAAKQPQHFPSRPPPPHPTASSQGNLVPARPAPAPPLYSSLA
ncbi:disintegrin and metalloproteinase domain-containing protein 9-like [Fukomys damarensis]|uniref:disintegrin and metalloproteinase domain-containing protein 9-like n=1 Tax=Fukomys damarensis TaxID=885580 RepID=UPI00053F2C82|nr:disintegrin and metalloproteinase domain-containing protein 9-like [Fukomys damarensis]